MLNCPRCAKEVVPRPYCVECGEDLSELIAPPVPLKKLEETQLWSEKRVLATFTGFGPPLAIHIIILPAFVYSQFIGAFINRPFIESVFPLIGYFILITGYSYLFGGFAAFCAAYAYLRWRRQYRRKKLLSVVAISAGLGQALWSLVLAALSPYFHYTDLHLVLLAMPMAVAIAWYIYRRERFDGHARSVFCKKTKG
jgi:hypothetical protein